jgi:hypothetical protein
VGWVYGVTGALLLGHREANTPLTGLRPLARGEPAKLSAFLTHHSIARLIMTTATKKLYAVVESWSAPMAIPGFKGYWVKINIQRGDIKSAEQTALALMAEGQIARVRMLDLNTGRYEAFPV